MGQNKSDKITGTFAFTVFLSTELKVNLLTGKDARFHRVMTYQINAEAKCLSSSPPFSIKAGQQSPHSEQV